MDDACLTCPLPDCDERSPRCAMRRLSNSYRAKNDRGAQHTVTEAERRANSFMFHIWRLDRSADASEGGRPYRRWEREQARRAGRARHPAGPCGGEA